VALSQGALKLRLSAAYVKMMIGRTCALPVRRAGDTLAVEPLGKQGSGMLSSMVGIHALAVIDGPARVLAANVPVRIIALAPDLEARTDLVSV